MPRGWLKHKSRRVGKKASRGGSSYHSSKKKNQNHDQRSKSRAFPTRHSKPHRGPTLKENNVCSLIADESWMNDHNFTNGEKPYSNSKSRKRSTVITKNDEKHQCPICCEIRPLFSLVRKCHHPPTCRECFYEMYVTQAQQDVSNYPLECYHPECSKPILSSQLINHNIFRSDEELQKHQRFSVLAKAYSSSKNIVHCPDCDFPKLIVSQNKAFCRRCKSKYEVAYDAKHNKVSTIKALEAIEEDDIGYNEGWTYCPGCKMIVSKGEGCYHMTCVCGEEFFWDEVTIQPKVKMAVAKTVQRECINIHPSNAF